MEAKVNLVLLGVLVAIWAGLTIAEPVSAMNQATRATQSLANLEDRFARDRQNAELVQQLADRYIEMGHPALAVTVLSAADDSLRDDPRFLHRLAQAYEASSRVGDAVDTAELALARCARALGTREASTVTPVPSSGCSERTYAVLDVHLQAVATMQRWGITEPGRDPRARTAYHLAMRTARIYNATASR